MSAEKRRYECIKDIFKTWRDLKDIELKGRNTKNKQRRYKINSIKKKFASSVKTNLKTRQRKRSKRILSQRE